MIRILGFVVVITTVAFCIRPSFFLETLGFEKKQPNTETTAPRDLIEANARGGQTSDEPLDLEEGESLYAEGYDSLSFSGDAYQPPQEGPSISKDDVKDKIWKTLMDLEFDVRYDADLDQVIFKPLFTAAILALEGKEIEIKGFVIPLEMVEKVMEIPDDMFMFSGLPLASCYFCTDAGPETVMEVLPAKPISLYNPNDAVTLRGTLRFNREDYLRLPYVLENAVRVRR